MSMLSRHVNANCMDAVKNLLLTGGMMFPPSQRVVYIKSRAGKNGWKFHTHALMANNLKLSGLMAESWPAALKVLDSNPRQ